MILSCYDPNKQLLETNINYLKLESMQIQNKVHY